MKIGLIGLGLIGGSIAKAIKEKTQHTVVGYDADERVLRKAMMLLAIDDVLDEEEIASCDLLILALYPRKTVEVLQEKAPWIGKDTLVVDCSGVKRNVCQQAEAIAKEYGFLFIGGHPMAGIEYAGFDYSKTQLFHRASMILTPPSGTDIATVDRLKRFFLQLGFGRVEITTPEIHDRRIAFTSQLAHVVSNAYVKSETASDHKGFSAGSYKDLTRVAKLEPDMWAELFMENKENLIDELDGLMGRLKLYREALCREDEEDLRRLLAEGSQRKFALDAVTKNR